MKKTVCPRCGGTLIVENLCQYGEQQKVCLNGKISKQIKRVDHGSIEFQYLFCAGCGNCFKEDEFEIKGDRVLLITEDEE